MTSKKDDELAELKAMVEAQAKQIASLTATAAPIMRTGAVDPEVASKAVKAAHSEEAKTYVATENGIDHKQGFIPIGKVFSTTQPKGSWMEPYEASGK